MAAHREMLCLATTLIVATLPSALTRELPVGVHDVSGKIEYKQVESDYTAEATVYSPGAVHPGSWSTNGKDNDRTVFIRLTSTINGVAPMGEMAAFRYTAGTTSGDNTQSSMDAAMKQPFLRAAALSMLGVLSTGLAVGGNMRGRCFLIAAVVLAGASVVYAAVVPAEAQGKWEVMACGWSYVRTGQCTASIDLKADGSFSVNVDSYYGLSGISKVTGNVVPGGLVPKHYVTLGSGGNLQDSDSNAFRATATSIGGETVTGIFPYSDEFRHDHGACFSLSGGSTIAMKYTELMTDDCEKIVKQVLLETRPKGCGSQDIGTETTYRDGTPGTCMMASGVPMPNRLPLLLFVMLGGGLAALHTQHR